MAGRDYSLIAVAVMFVIFGLAFSNAVIPNYHRQQALEVRRADLQQELKDVQAENAKIEDEIAALDDPYYMAHWLRANLGYRDAIVEQTPPAK
jgi:cell division protein FtsB